MSFVKKVVYSGNHGKHVGSATSAECPERIDAIIEHITRVGKNAVFVENYKNTENEIALWEDGNVNCSACTFPLQIGKVCEMCGTRMTHQWRYIRCDGDTTYETPFTSFVVEENREIVSNSCIDILNETYKQVFCAIRPPGHHSCEETRGGFCHYNYAVEALDIFHKRGKTAVIFDIDAHFGDGTVREMKKRNYGCYVSIHGYGEDVYPKGMGETVTNDTLILRGLSKNAGDEEWLKAFWECHALLEKKSYDILIVSCGLDALESDTMAPLKLSYTPFEVFGKVFKTTPTLYILEGGYNVQTIPNAVSMILLGKTC